MYYYYHNPTFQKDNFSINEALLEKMSKIFEIEYRIITIQILNSLLDKESEQQGIVKPNIDKPLDEECLIIYDMDKETDFPNLITFYPQIPTSNNVKSNNDIQIWEFLCGILLKIVIVSSLNNQKEVVSKKIMTLIEKNQTKSRDWTNLEF